MINKLTVEGFKSLLNNSIDLNRLNILTGLNSSGKSSIIQSLRILSRFSQHIENPLIEGHGDAKELQNPNIKSPFKITAEYGENTYKICYSPEDKDKILDNENNFPELIFISAERYGSLVSIPMSSDDLLGSKGENVIKCIELHGEDILNELLFHENSEGDTFLFNLRYFREREGYTQTELAEKVGLSSSIISQYENGAKVPSLPVADAIAQTLHVTCDDLVRGERRKRE